MRKSISLILILVCMVVFVASAQPGPPPPDPGQPLPITGIEILVGLGCLLGIKKLRDSRNKNS